MKGFLKRNLLFFAPVLVLLYPLDLLLSNGLRHSVSANGEIQVLSDLYEGNINRDFIILGTSHAYIHIDPIAIERETGLSGYNLGGDAFCFELQYFYFRELLKYNQKPRYVICVLDNVSFGTTTGTNKVKFLPFMLWNRDIYGVMQKLSIGDFSEYAIPLVRYIGNYNAIQEGMKYYIKPDSSSQSRVNGYKAMRQNWYTDFRGGNPDVARKSMQARSVAGLREKMTHLSLFGQFVEECKQEGIKLIFVCTPEYKDDGKVTDYEKAFIKFVTDDISIKYDIPLFSYENDTLSFSKEYYYNYTHLNKRGSQLFSQKFAKDFAVMELKNK